MKVHIRPERRGEGYRVAIEYQLNGSKAMLVGPEGLHGGLIRDMVVEGASWARMNKSAEKPERVAQEKPGGQQ